MLVQGTVTEISGRFARVSVVRASGCGRCNDAGGCGAAATCQSYTLNNAVSAGLGETVELELPEGGAWKAAIWAYLLPLCGILLGAFAGKLMAFSDLGLFLACLAGGGGVASASALAMKLGWIEIMGPHLVRVSRA